MTARLRGSASDRVEAHGASHPARRDVPRHLRLVVRVREPALPYPCDGPARRHGDAHLDGARGGGRMSGTPGSTRPLVDVRLEALSTRGGRPPGGHQGGVHVRYGEVFPFLRPPQPRTSEVLRAIAGLLPV